MSHTFPVVLLPRPEGGCFVQCPTLPGCYSRGDTVEEAMTTIREAVELAIADIAASGQPVPQSGSPIFTGITIAG